MKSILITGGAGFIGSNFTHYMAKKYPRYNLHVLDALTYAGNRENLADLEGRDTFSFTEGNICDEKVVHRIVPSVDAIVHFAAETHVDRSILKAGEFIQTDVYGTFILLEAARKSGTTKFLHISTDEVYGEAGDVPSREDSPLKPKSPYAASKAGADRLVYSYYTTYGVPAVITRCTNNYGPYQYPEKLIPLFVTNAMEGKQLPVYGTGKNTRDWIFVEDHCKALDIVLHSEGCVGEVFNIGSGREFSILEITKTILARLGKNEELIRFVKDRPGHVQRHAVDTEKIRSAFGWEPARTFEDAIGETIDWYRENEHWWEMIKNKQEEYKRFYRELYGRELQ
jgi:dTDP-glucose 4,6-dehydratase